ncbi:MAG: serine/threonine-protein kinase [Acidobacteriota bacterium]
MPKPMICPQCHISNSAAARFCNDCGAALEQTQPAGASAAAQAARPAANLIGHVIDGKYRLDALLGAGGMGQVYSATRLHIGDVVAVKLLQPQLAADTQMLERFRREAQAAARLKHPNVVTIHDFGRAREGWLYLVMELIEGGSLRALLARQGALAPVLAAEIIAQICAAVDEAHGRGIVHRDLKPDNVIVTQTTRGLHVKVLDFGIARWRDLAAGAGTLTASGAVLGTPQYMSPEQCLGEEVDGRADIYSLGVMLYEMLAGSAPFNAPTPSAMIAQQLHYQPPPMSGANTQVPPAVEAVVRSALEKDPAARPQTAGELARQLTGALNLTAARASTQLGQLGQLESGSVPRSHTAPRPVASAATLPKANAAAATSGRQRIEINLDRPTGNQAMAASGGRLPRRGIWLLLAILLLVGGGAAWWQWQSANWQTGGAPLSGSPATGAPLDGPRATAQLGESLFNAGNAECIGLLTRALAAGETIKLPVKHHHYEGVLHVNDGFCDGTLVFDRNQLRFESREVSAHSFMITPRGLIDLRNEAHKAGRIYTKLSLPQGANELKQTYNFYPAVAELQENRLRTAVRCDNAACRTMADALYQMLRQFQR